MKKLSIITINYNNCEGLARTCQSVVSQSNQDFEWIIIDGGSTDGSVDVIKEYASYIDYWVSEPDRGIYNAMNKGVRAASGKYCQFLNSGDWYYDNEVVNKFNQYTNTTDIILGFTAHIKKKSINIGRSVTDTISFITLIKSGINHQSSFIKRELCTRFPYDESYKICSDFKFYLQTLIVQNCSFSTVDDIIVYFDLEGISNINTELNHKERDRVIKEFGVYDRILQDYKYIDLNTYDICKRLHPHLKLRYYICKIDRIIIHIYEKFNRNRKQNNHDS